MDFNSMMTALWSLVLLYVGLWIAFQVGMVYNIAKIIGFKRMSVQLIGAAIMLLVVSVGLWIAFQFFTLQSPGEYGRELSIWLIVYFVLMLIIGIAFTVKWNREHPDDEPTHFMIGWLMSIAFPFLYLTVVTDIEKDALKRYRRGDILRYLKSHPVKEWSVEEFALWLCLPEDKK